MRQARLREIATVRPSNVDKKATEGEEPIRLCNYTDVYKNDFIDSSLDFMPASAPQRQIETFTLRRDDVLITKDSETADDIAVPALVLEDLPGVLCGYHLALIRPDSSQVEPRFLFRSLLTNYVNQQFEVGATGVTRFGLRSEIIKDARIPLPDLTEQRLIADFLDRALHKIDALEDVLESRPTLLVEYRQALITAAVTGQLSEATLKGYKPVEEAMARELPA